MFARFEVLRLDRLLGGFDTLRNQPRFDRHALFHAKPMHDLGNALAGKDAQQVVFKRKIEAGRAGVTLTARASSQLVVNAAGLVPLRAEDVQTAEIDHPFVLGVGDGLKARDELAPVLTASRVSLELGGVDRVPRAARRTL